MNIYYVIFTGLAVILSIVAIIAPFILSNSLKTSFQLKIETNSLKIQALGTEFESIKTDMSRLKFENYESLAQKVLIMQGDMSSVSQEVKSLDAAIKNFYSKWARKLGRIDKAPEAAPAIEEIEDPELALPDGFALEPTNNHVQKKKSGLKKSKFFA